MKKLHIFALIIILISAGVVLGLFYFFSQQQAPKQENQNPTTQQPITTLDSMILKIPILEYKAPGNILSDPVVSGYTNKVVEKESEFIIEPSTLGYMLGGQVGDIKLKLIEIKNNSVVVDVLADKRFDGNFYPRKTIERKEILSGDCVSAFPLVMDAYYKLCFTIENENGRIALKYSVQGESTMPVTK